MDPIQKQRVSVADHIRLENEHHWAEVPSTLVQDERAFFDFVAVGQFTGTAGVQQLYQTIGTAFPDLRIDISHEYDVPGCSIREGFISGTHRGEYMGIPASGISIRIAMAAFFVFDQTSGALLGERLYLDHGTVLQQLKSKQP
jgi:steroid delta-isomerase-like uncharacterized protein